MAASNCTDHPYGYREFDDLPVVTDAWGTVTLRHPGISGWNVITSIQDFLRLLTVVAFVWASIHDIRTRRIPNWIWPPLFVMGVLLFAWDAWNMMSVGGFEWRLFVLRSAISFGLVAPLGYVFFRLGAFGGADAKAVIVLAVIFPTYPVFLIDGTILPLVVTPLGVFSLTILTNAVVIGATYPIMLAALNAVATRFTPMMFVGRPIHWSKIETTHGRLIETTDGFTRHGLDLDALRMYLRWRGCTIEDLRNDPVTLRDPMSLPNEPNTPGDGMVADGGLSDDITSSQSASSSGSTAIDDPWGAIAFLEAAGPAYGTRPDTLRSGLEVIIDNEQVWVSPGIPFIVPIFLGLVVGLTYGDLLFTLLAVIGAV